MADPIPTANTQYTPAQIAEAQAREAAGRAQAEATNQAYLNNTLPVLPRMGSASPSQERFIAYDTTGVPAGQQGRPY